MIALRRNLRLLASTWLVCQVAWLAALGPHACCMSERPAEKACHESVPQPPECRLVSNCDGPLGALLTQFANHGVLPHSTEAPQDVLEDSAVALTADSTAGQFQPPDPPPPRA